MQNALQERLDEVKEADAVDTNNWQILKIKNVEQAVLDIQNEIELINTAFNDAHTEIHELNDGEMSAATVIERKSIIGRCLE